MQNSNLRNEGLYDEKNLELLLKADPKQHIKIELNDNVNEKLYDGGKYLVFNSGHAADLIQSKTIKNTDLCLVEQDTLEGLKKDVVCRITPDAVVIYLLSDLSEKISHDTKYIY